MSHLNCSHTCHALGPLPYTVPTLLWRPLLLGLHPTHSGTWPHTVHVGSMCFWSGFCLPSPWAAVPIQMWISLHCTVSPIPCHSVSLWHASFLCVLCCFLGRFNLSSLPANLHIPWTVVQAWQVVRANTCTYRRGPTPMPRTVFRALQLSPSSPVS